MSPIPGEPLDPRQPDLTTKDGQKVRLKIPGLTPLGASTRTGKQAGDEPARDDPRPPVNPDQAGS